MARKRKPRGRAGVVRNPVGPGVDCWHTGRSRPEGVERYVHIIRADDDPPRMSRKEAKAAGKNRTAEWRRLSKAPESEIRAAFRRLLSDGAERTFNAMCVELWDSTADINFGKAPDDALWAMVADGELEHTCVAPIRFRLVSSRGEAEDMRKASIGTEVTAEHREACLIPSARDTVQPACDENHGQHICLTCAEPFPNNMMAQTHGDEHPDHVFAWRCMVHGELEAYE